MRINTVLSKERRRKKVKTFCSTERVKVGEERAEVSLAMLQRKAKALDVRA